MPTCRLKGSSPTSVAWPVVELYPALGRPPDPDDTPFTLPSVQGVYRLPSAAHDGYLFCDRKKFPGVAVRVV